MDVVLFWGIIAIFCALLQSLGFWKYGLLCGFVITTTLLAIHYDFGNDYWSYYDWFEESLSMPLPNTISEFLEMSRDPGWDILNLFFGGVFGDDGFFIMVAVLSVIEGLCYYRFIKNCISPRWYWFAMALYVFNNHLFILSFSMMRQSFVMAVLLFCYLWIQERRIILPAIVILLLSTIHNSVLLCLPFVFFSYIPIKNQRVWSIWLVCLWLLFLVFSSILEPILLQFAKLTEMFARYAEVYSETGDMTFGFGYFLRVLPFFALLYALFFCQIEEDDLPLVLIWSLSIIFIPFGTIIPIFGRLLFYFELLGLVVFPKIIVCFRNIIIRMILVLSILIFPIQQLRNAFYDPASVYYDAFLHFSTIFEVL